MKGMKFSDVSTENRIIQTIFQYKKTGVICSNRYKNVFLTDLF